MENKIANEADLSPRLRKVLKSTKKKEAKKWESSEATDFSQRGRWILIKLSNDGSFNLEYKVGKDTIGIPKSLDISYLP